jgi:hypothetical protein
MARKRHSDEDVLKLLREVEVKLSAGSDVQSACRGVGISEATYYNWRKRGGKASKRGLSHEQVPILVAVDRTGVTVSAVLPFVSAASLQAALEPVLSKDALLVTDCCTSYPPCAAALGVSHEALNQSAGERVRGDLHIQTANSRHERLKVFLRLRRGVATEYISRAT